MSVEGPPAQGAEPESPSLVGQILDNRYRLVRKIGEGGMGEVYAAEHIHIEKKFAIKLLRQEIVSNPEAVTRFRQEARSSSSIGHRNIIAVEDFGQLSDGRIYMCMELLNGAPLNDMLTQPMAVDRLLNILIQTGHGLAAAHAKNIIHRDMKPENIFVTVGPNGEEVPKILDFGIAKVAGNDGQNHLTRTGTIFGTPYYMAPEQALGNHIDIRTDIYAVGVIMYECFAGSLPFQGDSFMGILTQHITMDPEPVTQRAAKAGRQLPAGLADVITRCMQKNPAQRFGSMDELVTILIQIYRGMVGPGMSSYMEAFPVQASAAYQIPGTAAHPIPTPPPTGAVVIHSGANAATIAATGPSGSAPHVIPGMSPGSSGLYPGQGPGYGPGAQLAPKKSRLGLVIAIIAVLAVGGGVTAFVVAGKGGGGSGSGSGTGGKGTDNGQIAGTDGSGRDGPRHDGTGAGTDFGSHPADAAEPPDAAPADAALPPDASNVPPPGRVEHVKLIARGVRSFEVYENGVKLFDGPGTLDVPIGETRTVVIKAKGYRDKTLEVPGVNKPMTFGLEHERVQPLPPHNPDHPDHPDIGHLPDGGHDTPPVVPTLNCTNAILDAHNKACIDQYCAAHPQDFAKCHLE